MRCCAACALVLVVLAVASCGGGGGSGSESSAPSSAGAPAPATTATQAPSTTAAQADGRALFTSNGCSGCHTLAEAGAHGTTGPDLDKQLASDAKAAGQPLDEFVRQSIVEPDAYVAMGYSRGVMPKNFGDALSPGQLDALVAYVSSAGR